MAPFATTAGATLLQKAVIPTAKRQEVRVLLVEVRAVVAPEPAYPQTCYQKKEPAQGGLIHIL